MPIERNGYHITRHGLRGWVARHPDGDEIRAWTRQVLVSEVDKTARKRATRERNKAVEEIQAQSKMYADMWKKLYGGPVIT